ncbi:type II CAAX endopeptidase family protein [Dokdonella soli]|uniref:CAAX prenyl protease 2/Lysostaphin resistance protein A-like domain-containing protein n=1 Tax=Dokdonella soli TaxID=529810 RepID=A0ABP3TTC2_9GAMM
MLLSLVVSEGRLRPIWRALVFLVLVLFVLPWLLNAPTNLAWKFLHLEDSLNAAAVAFQETELLIQALIATALFAFYEHRRIDGYGLPVARALGSSTWEGMAAGVFMAAIVAAGMLLLGGMQINGFATTGGALAASALAWLGANIVIAVAEEFFFRSYVLQTLWRSLGFWPASIATTAVFVALHYFFKQGENIWDVITLVSLSLLMCDTVRRTGTLWFAVGFHVAFDYMQFFVIGTPNGALVPVGRMLDVNFQGPAWLTGGVLGTEASLLMYPAIALVWLYVVVRYRDTPIWQPDPEVAPKRA